MPSCLPLCVCHQGTISTFSSPHFISLQGSFYTKLIWSLLLLEYYHHFPLCQISHYSPFLPLYRSNITCDLNQTYKRQLNINLEDLSMAFSFILVTIIPRTFFLITLLVIRINSQLFPYWQLTFLCPNILLSFACTSWPALFLKHVKVWKGILHYCLLSNFFSYFFSLLLWQHHPSNIPPGWQTDVQ